MIGFTSLTLMSKTKINRNTLSIQLLDTFISNYSLYKKTKDTLALSKCLNMVSFNFVQWQADYQQPDYNQNINILTLFSLLAKDDKPKAEISWKKETYNKYLKDNNLSFYDHCIEAFLMHMNKDTIVYDRYPKDYKFLFYLSQEIKYALFKIIRKILQQSKRDWFTNPTFLDLQKEHNQSYDLQIDLSFLFFSDKFLHSLIMLLIYEEATWKDIKNKYNLNNKQLADAKKEVIKWISTVL